MNTKTVAISLSIITGLIGVGLVINHYLDSKPPGKEVKSKLKSQGHKPKDKPATSPKEAHVTNVDNKPAAVDPVAQVASIPKEDATAIAIEQSVLQEETSPLPPIPERDDSFPLQLGSNGKRVERLQIWLMRNYGLTGTITGVFDSKTQEQVNKRLHSDTVDEATYEKYRMEKPVHQQAVIK